MYCTKADILADFKALKVEDSGTAVTTSSLEEIIEQESNYIDARIGLRYQNPVDENDYPEAFSILKRICIFRVSERVKSITEIKGPSTQQTSDEKADVNKVRRVKTDLDLIVEGSLLLKDVPLLNQNGSVSSWAIDNCGSNVFDMNKDNW
jgi:hypothetical protein